MRRTAFLPLAVLSAGCFTARPLDRSAAEPLGSFRVESTALGSSEWKVSGCVAGSRQSFLGADFRGAEGTLVVRLAVDPIHGPAVKVYDEAAPFDRAEVFRRSDCSVFHFSLGSTGWRINDVDDYQVSLELDCGSAGGPRLAGRASTSHCH